MYGSNHASYVYHMANNSQPFYHNPYEFGNVNGPPPPPPQPPAAYYAPPPSFGTGDVSTLQHPYMYQTNTCKNPSLRDALDASDFVLKPITGDGNCFFTAVADEIIRLMNEDPHFELHIFRIMDTTFIPTRSVLAHSLRHICVRDWLKREKYYSQFLKHKVDFEKEARSFLKDGFFKSALGDLVPLTIANTLTVNLVIFTSNKDLPIIKVKPEYCDDEEAKELKFIFLAYNQEGNGHYDVAVQRTL